MSEASEEWELSKENIKPIQQGRKAKVLKVALSTHPEDVMVQQRQSFENELRTYSGDDPLVVWFEYIKWVEQNFPKGGREGHIKELIERCLSILKSEKKYYDDDRFIDIMLKYAIIGEKPINVYNYMFSNNIGCKSAQFFINWSWELEQMSNLKKADEILNEGMQRRAEPYEKIHSYHKDFEIRLAGKIKANVEQNNSESESSRSAFASLKPQKKNLAPILRTGKAVENGKMPLILGRQQPQPKNIASSVKIPFQIYDSENNDSSLPIQSLSIVPNDLTLENYKENERKPSKWNTVKVNVHNMYLKKLHEAKPGFKFHCDDEPEFHIPRSVPKISKILTTRCRSPTLPMAFFEPPDPLTRNMYPKNKIYGGAEEFSLEEIRAAEWFDNRKKTEQEMLLGLQQKKIDEKQKTEEELKKQIECLSKQLELLQSHSQSSMSEEFNTRTNCSESVMTENSKLNKKENCETSHIQNNTQNDSDSHFKQNLDTFSFKNCPAKSCFSNKFENIGINSTSCRASEVGQNLDNNTRFYSVNEDEYKLNSNNEFGGKYPTTSSNNFLSSLNEMAQHEKIQSIPKESNANLPFTFFHDPINES